MTAKTTADNDGCSLSTFERNAYFYGKLLTVRDFQAEQQYFMGKERTAHRLLHGTGIVCGLKVHGATYKDDQLEIDLGEGYALDCCGHEIVVPTRQKTKVEKMAPSETYSSRIYRLYLEYVEKTREPTPLPDTADTSVKENCAYGRIREGYKLTVSPASLTSSEAGRSIGQAADQPEAISSCAELAQQYYQGNLYKCPECTDARVFLAVVEIDDQAGSATINEAETIQGRSIVYNNPLLRDLLCGHLADSNNPHHTTAEQVGALVSVKGVDNPGGNIDLIAGGAIQITANTDDKTITIGESHSARTDNPHHTTAAQVGALVSVDGVDNPGGNIDLIAGGAIQITANTDDKTITISENHSANRGNPHNTTAAQVGALVSVEEVKGDPEGNLNLTSSDGSIKIQSNPEEHNIDLKIANVSGHWPVISKIDWQNDRPMTRVRFNEGLQVTFSEPVHRATVTLDTFIVTIELPENGDDTGLTGHRSLIVRGAIERDDAMTWRFTPTPEITPVALSQWISAENKLFPPGPDGASLRCRVVLKGNAILDEKGTRPLDGDVYAAVTGIGGMFFSRLILPSGDGHKGGDFESWFYLTPDKSDEEPGHEADFTRIKGIGPAFDQRLKDANVLTFADLAARTPEEVADILGVSTERVVKGELIEQARLLAQAG